MAKDTENKKQDIEKLSELIKGIKVAMMTTLEPNGRFHVRPMATQKSPFDGTLWFFTKSDSPKAQELNQNSQVALAYAEPDKSRYISVYGKGQTLEDREKAKELWNPVLHAWFPEGLDDPQLALLRVDVECAEYWDSASSRMVQLFGLARAAVTGKGGENLGDHKRIDLAG